MAWGYGYTAGHYNRNPNSEGSLAIRPNSNAQARWSGTPGHFGRNPNAEGSPGFGTQAIGPYLTQPQDRLVQGNPNTGKSKGGGGGGGFNFDFELPMLEPLPMMPMPNFGAMFQQPMQQMTPTYTSSINAGPVWNPEQTAAGVNAIRSGGSNLQVPSFIGGGGAKAELLQQMNDATGANNARAATGFDRTAGAANVAQQMAGELARSRSGISMANLLGQMEQTQVGNQMRDRQQLLNLLMGLV